MLEADKCDLICANCHRIRTAADAGIAEHLSRIRKGKPGRPMSEENKKRLSIATKGRRLSQEHKEKLSEANRGKVPWNKGFSARRSRKPS